MISKLLRRRRGQGMTEYIVIVGLVAIVLIAAIRSYSGTVNDIIVGTDGNGGGMAATAAVGSCPLYLPLHINTAKRASSR